METYIRPTTAQRTPRLFRLCRNATLRPLNRITILTAAISGIAASLVAAPDGRGVFGAGLAVLAVLIAAVDARYFIIPDELTIATLLLGLCTAVVGDPDMAAEALPSALLRGLLLALMFWGFRVAYRQLRGREGIGFGDVKLAGVAGVWLSWLFIPLSIELAAAGALVSVVIRRLILGHEIREVSRLPFGLFFAPSIWLGWLVEVSSNSLSSF